MTTSVVIGAVVRRILVVGRTIDTPTSARHLEQLYRRYHRRIRWVLRSRGIGDQELDDLVHDVFLAIHRRHAHRDPRVDEERWVTGVARNIAFAHRRGRARRLRMLDTAPEPMATQLPDEHVGEREAWSALQSFLETLNAEQREAFVLMDLLGMATAEIAEVTGTPANTVSSRVRLARRRFDRHFARLRGREAAFLRAARIAERPSPRERQRTWAAIAAAIPQAAGPAATSTAASSSLTPWTVGGAMVAMLAVAIVAPPRAPTSDRANAASRTSPRAAGVRGHGSRPATPAAVELEDGTETAPPPPSSPAQSDPTATPQPLGTLDPSTAAASPKPRNRRTQPRPETHAKPDTTQSPRAADSPRSTESLETATGSSTELTQAVALLRTAEAHLAAGDGAAALTVIDTYHERFGAGPLHRDRLRIEARAACAEGQRARARRAHAQLVQLGLASTPSPDCP